MLIGLGDGHGIRYGLIDQPYTRERFEGGLGRAQLTGPGGRRRLAVRRDALLADATLMTTFPEIGTPAEANAFRRVADRVRLTRYGLDCYAYALLALGHVDLVIEAGLQPYDIAGLWRWSRRPAASSPTGRAGRRRRAGRSSPPRPPACTARRWHI